MSIERSKLELSPAERAIQKRHAQENNLRGELVRKTLHAIYKHKLEQGCPEGYVLTIKDANEAKHSKISSINYKEMTGAFGKNLYFDNMLKMMGLPHNYK